MDLRLIRPLQQGSQHYDTDPGQYPLNKPVSKIEADVQCTGEAEYVGDITARHDELHAAFVLTDRAACDIDTVDTSSALDIEGVIDFISVNDIPGVNNVKPGKFPEPLFTTSEVRYAGQAVGVIVAKSQELADKAARRVKISYTNMKKPMLTIKDVLKMGDDDGRVSSDPVGDAVEEGDVDEEMSKGEVTVSGEFESGSQYHFHLETQTCVVIPEEDGVRLVSTTQYMDSVQRTVAGVLSMRESDVNISVRRLGGGFGGKISQQNNVAAACAVAAHKLRRPVRMKMSLRTNMMMLGKRLPYLFKYKASVDSEKKLVGVSMRIWCDSGYAFNESTADAAAKFAKNVYNRLYVYVAVLDEKYFNFFQYILENLSLSSEDRHSLQHLCSSTGQHSGARRHGDDDGAPGPQAGDGPPGVQDDQHDWRR